MLNRGKGLLPSPRRAVDSSIIRLHPYHGLELDYLTSILHTMVLGWAGHNCTQTLAFLAMVAIQVHLCGLNEHMGQGQDCIDRIGAIVQSKILFITA